MGKSLKISILSAVICVSLTAASQTVIKGKVFVDLNRNGVFDSGDEGISKVKITDGFTFVLSGVDGEYAIEPHPEARFIYISIPAFYDLPGAFYHPLPLNGNADFGLIYCPNQSPYFIQTADNEEHCYWRWHDELKAFIGNESPAFLITTGDICYEKGLHFHAREFTTEKMGTRVWFTLGNHDLIDYGAYGETLYEELFGPCRYSFDVGNTHFVVFPMLTGDHPTGFTAKEVFNWIKHDLDLILPGQKVVFCSHDLILREEKGVPMLIFRSDTLNLEGYPIDSYIFGHRHNQITQRLPKSSIMTYGIGPANKGSRDRSPAAYRLFTLQPDGSIKSQIRYSLVNALLQPHASNTTNPQYITVNAYHTPSDISSVTIEGGKQVIALEKVSDWSWGTLTAIELARLNLSSGISSKKPLRVTATARDGSRFNTPLLPSDRLVWSRSLGGMTSIAPPLLVGDVLFVATYDGQMGSGDQICAVDTRDGALLWRFQTSNSVKSTMAHDSDNETLLACDVTGMLYALDPQTGNLRWQRQLLSFSPSTFQQGVATHLGVAYICSGSSAAAIHIKDGSILWNRELSPISSNTPATTTIYLPQPSPSAAAQPSPSGAAQPSPSAAAQPSPSGAAQPSPSAPAQPSPSGAAQPSPSAAANLSLLLTGTNWRTRAALNLENGEIVWQQADKGLRYCEAAPAPYNDLLYYPAFQYLSVVDPTDGSIVQSTTVQGTLGSTSVPCVNEELIVTGSSDRGIFAFSRNDLTQLWNFQTRQAITHTVAYASNNQQSVEASPILIDGVVYCGANDGYFYALDALTGTFLWSFCAGAPILSAAVYHDKHLFFTDMAGNIYKVKTGI